MISPAKETPATRKKRRRRKLKRIKKVEAAAAKDELLIDTPNTKKIMEEKAEEEAEPNPESETPAPPYDTLKEKEMDLAEPIELREIREEIIERKPNVFPFEPAQAPPPAGESAEVQLLKARLEAANLRAELAEARAGTTPKLVPSTEPVTAKPLPGTHPMPKPEEFPPGAPPMPEIDKDAGDKTPAVVEWFKKHWPAEYEKRYAGRKTHLKKKTHEEEGEEDEEAPVAGKKVKDFQPSSDPTVDTSARQY